ncbi:CHASE2 domain-containing protein [bacterium]|nr:MAG: CHASE2 domain-containing protein [bacterium]
MQLRICILLVVILSISFCSNKNMSGEELMNYFQKRGTISVSNNIVIVDISDQSFEELGNWPFPMSYYEKLVVNLNKAGAKLIVFDLDLNELDFDSCINNTHCNNVVFKGYFDINNNNSVKDTSGMVCFYPIQIYSNKSEEFSLGINVLRKLQLIRYKEEIQINNDEHVLKIHDIEIPKYSENQILINYYGPAHTFQYYHIDAVLDDSTFQVRTEQEFGFDLNLFDEHLKRDTFRDKIVLIGASAEELHDLFLTPFYNSGKRHGPTPGVEILANFLEMVIHNNYIGVQKIKQVKNSEKKSEIDESDKEVNEALIEHGKKLLEKGKKELHKGD